MHCCAIDIVEDAGFVAIEARDADEAITLLKLGLLDELLGTTETDFHITT